MSVDGSQVNAWDIKNQGKILIRHVFPKAGSFFLTFELTPENEPAQIATRFVNVK